MAAGLMKFLNSKRGSSIPAASPALSGVVSVPIDDLIPSERNFYRICDVESLASSIHVSGTIEPLIVCRHPNFPGKYKILSGHRRRAAVDYLLVSGERTDRKMPCVIKEFDDTGLLTPEEFEDINIILMNRGQRQKITALERLEEISKLEPIARKIYKSEKVEGSASGQFRKFFAEEILEISQSKLQRYKNLARLSPSSMEAFESGEITFTAAERLSKLPPEDQDRFLGQAKDASRMTAVAVDNFRMSLDSDYSSKSTSAEDDEAENFTPRPTKDRITDNDQEEEKEDMMALDEKTESEWLSSSNQPESEHPSSSFQPETTYPANSEARSSEPPAHPSAAEDRWVESELKKLISECEANNPENEDASLWSSRKNQLLRLLGTL